MLGQKAMVQGENLQDGEEDDDKEEGEQGVEEDKA